MNNSTELSGWEHPNRLQEGTYEQIKDRLQSALEQQFAENRNALDGYRQAVGLRPSASVKNYITSMSEG